MANIKREICFKKLCVISKDSTVKSLLCADGQRGILSRNDESEAAQLNALAGDFN